MQNLIQMTHKWPSNILFLLIKLPIYHYAIVQVTKRKNLTCLAGFGINLHILQRTDQHKLNFEPTKHIHISRA